MSWVSTNPIFFQHYLLNTIFWLTQNFKVHFSLLLFSPSFWWHIKAESYKCILKYITYVYWNVFCKIFATYSRHMKTVNWKWILKYINILHMYTGKHFVVCSRHIQVHIYVIYLRRIWALHICIQVFKQYTATPRKIRVGIPTHSRHIQDYTCIYRCCSDIVQRPKKLFWACQHMHA